MSFQKDRIPWRDDTPWWSRWRFRPHGEQLYRVEVRPAWLIVRDWLADTWHGWWCTRAELVTLQSERRWRRSNAQRHAAGCRCGAPSARVEVCHQVHGSVPYESWTCEEHYGAAGWTTDGDGHVAALWRRRDPCGSCPLADGQRMCPGIVSTIDTGQLRYYLCPERPDKLILMADDV